jgi:hypothetical protein
VLMRHSTKYTVQIGNHSHRRVDAQVTVDGKSIETFRLGPYQTMNLETPPNDPGKGCFTFYRASSDEAKAVGVDSVESGCRGLISVLFRSEKEIQIPRPVVQPRHMYSPGHGSSLRSTVKGTHPDEGTTAACSALPDEDIKLASAYPEVPYNSLSAGMTGLSGQSAQQFVTVGPIDIDPTLDVTINLRLVHSDDTPRPLVTSTPRSTAVPPAVG